MTVDRDQRLDEAIASLDSTVKQIRNDVLHIKREVNINDDPSKKMSGVTRAWLIGVLGAILLGTSGVLGLTYLGSRNAEQTRQAITECAKTQAVAECKKAINPETYSETTWKVR